MPLPAHSMNFVLRSRFLWPAKEPPFSASAGSPDEARRNRYSYAGIGERSSQVLFNFNSHGNALDRRVPSLRVRTD